MKRLLLLTASLMLVVAAAVTASAQAQNPCAMKKGQNPCAMKKGQNPCAKKGAMNPCNPCAKKSAMNPCSAKFNMTGKETSVVGYIGDSQCGLAHPMNMGEGKECTLKCVDGGGYFVLADRAKKTVYILDKEAQMKVRDFAGQKVKVTGHVNAKAKTIHMTNIEPAS